jgi:hypothetical protein
MQFQHHDPPRRTCTKQPNGTWTYRVRNSDRPCDREHDEAMVASTVRVIILDADMADLALWLAERGQTLFEIASRDPLQPRTFATRPAPPKPAEPGV